MRTKEKHFRSLIVILACGCQSSIATSLYRVPQSTASIILGHAARNGVWCYEHNGNSQPVEYLGTKRTSQKRVDTKPSRG